MNIVLMKFETDCEVAAIATACGIDYEKAKKALGWRDLPGGLENPIFGNPWNLYRALIVLGFWKKSLEPSDLFTGRAEPGKTILLVKKSFTQQHWVVWGGVNAFGFHLIYWGDKEQPRYLTTPELESYLVKSWPDCAFTVYKANVWRLMWERLKGFFRGK